MGKQSKSKHKFGKMKVCEVEEVRGYFINLKIENGVFCQCINQVICTLDFRNILCSNSKNILLKAIVQYYLSILTCPSHIFENLFQNNKSLYHNYLVIKNFKKVYFHQYLPITQSIFYKLSLSILHNNAINGVISWYVLALYCLFHFIACLSFLSIALFFIYLFYVESTAC